jgi:peptide/nickel transport system substrate-binding protein
MKFFNKLPPLFKFRHLPKILSAKEKIWLAVFTVLALGSAAYLSASFYFSRTRAVPDFGGTLVEGITGEPRFINPLLSQTDSERDLVEIIFSGLVKYDADSQIVPDLANAWEISEDGRTYTLFLRQDVLWHDGEKFTADDVIFTIAAAQNPDYKSSLRFNWQGIKAEKINDFQVTLTLPNPYAPFLESLTLKILPRHIWQNVPAKNFHLAKFNTEPVGTGPYFVKSLAKDKQGSIKSYELAAFPKYFLGKPNIKSLKFVFFENEEALVSALNKKEVMAAAGLRAKSLGKIKKSGLTVLKLKMPRYYAVFFNPVQSQTLNDASVRLALNIGTDKERIIEKVLQGKGIIVHSPILPGSLGYGPDLKKYEYNPDEAKNILEKAGWREPKDADENGMKIREKTIGKAKEPTKLEINLTIPQSPELIETATLIKENWLELGAKINLLILPAGEIQENIKQRSYEALIFGEILNADPDPFPFWHSSQKNDPGLNLAMYGNSKTDKLLEEARQTLDETERARKYENFQEILIGDAPAVFLYSPDFLYAVNSKIKGIELNSVILPSKRFGEIEKWYIKTKRAWKSVL